jgi:adenine/guanine phosphoribosyltransferase-like PRPP-binding protein
MLFMLSHALENLMKPPAFLVAVMMTAGLLPAAHAASRNGPVIPAQAAPEVCTEVYQPVCGTDANGKRVTYSNACFARVAKATGVTPGGCPK